MRKKSYVLMTALWLATLPLTAQTYAINSPRFARPLVETWIEEYAKVEPGIHFRLLNGCGCTEETALYVLPFGSGDAETIDHGIVFAEYAILPFMAADSEAAQILGGHKFSCRRLCGIFFDHDTYVPEEELTKLEKRQKRLVVYSANNGASTTDPFAAFFNESKDNLRGKRISGDDLFLNTAVKKAPLGVSFNALSNLYDLNSRQLKDGLTIVPLDTKREIADAFSNRATLDTMIELLEQHAADNIPVGKVALAYKSLSKAPYALTDYAEDIYSLFFAMSHPDFADRIVQRALLSAINKTDKKKADIDVSLFSEEDGTWSCLRQRINQLAQQNIRKDSASQQHWTIVAKLTE